MLRAALASVLFATGALAAEPPQVLIGGGGTEESQADDWLRAFQQRFVVDGALEHLVTFAPGFPKVVASASVEGLKPGLYVVLLGFCSAEDAPSRLGTLRMLDGGAYARATTSLPKDACPQVKPFPPPGDDTWSAGDTLDLGGGLVLSTWTHRFGDDRQLLARLTRDGQLVDGYRVPPAGDAQRALDASCSQSTTVDAKAKAVVVDEDCRLAVPGEAAGCVADSSGTFSLSVDEKGRLKVKATRQRTGRPRCSGE